VEGLGVVETPKRAEYNALYFALSGQKESQRIDFGQGTMKKSKVFNE
jgi:hypothetical protein